MRKSCVTWQSILLLSALCASSFCITFEMLWSGASIGTRIWSLCNTISACTQWAMPSLIVLTGSIILSSERKIKTYYIWKYCIPYALLSCLIWWVISAIVWMANNHPSDLDFYTFREGMTEVLEAPANIGFCQMLVSLFIMYPLLQRIANNEKVLRYSIFLLFFMSLVEPLFKNIPYLSAVALFMDQLNWGYYRAWTFYLLCGIWITKYERRWNIALIMYSLGIITIGAIMYLTSNATTFHPGFANEYIGYSSPLAGIQTLAVCLFFKRVFSTVVVPSLNKHTKNLWHSVPIMYVCSMFTERLTGLFTSSGLVDAICNAVVCAIVTFFIVYVWGKLPIFRIFVGDYIYDGGKSI